MTKKDFELIAKKLREAQDDAETVEASATITRLTENLANSFQHHYSGFHKVKFLNASAASPKAAA